MKNFLYSNHLIKCENNKYISLTLENNFNSRILLEKISNFKTFKKKLSLVGLGYKCQIGDSSLNFKLNFSHQLEIIIPSYIIRVSQKKQTLYFESKDKILLGNFVENLYNLRPSSVYKFKGFMLESKLNILKEINKKNKKT